MGVRVGSAVRFPLPWSSWLDPTPACPPASYYRVIRSRRGCGAIYTRCLGGSASASDGGDPLAGGIPALPLGRRRRTWTRVRGPARDAPGRSRHEQPSRRWSRVHRRACCCSGTWLTESQGRPRANPVVLTGTLKLAEPPRVRPGPVDRHRLGPRVLVVAAPASPCWPVPSGTGIGRLPSRWNGDSAQCYRDCSS